MWRTIIKRFGQSQKIIFFLALCILSTALFIYYQLATSGTYQLGNYRPSTASKRKNFDECECKGWRSHFVANEEEKRIFQSVRLEHIHLLEKLEDAMQKLDEINDKIPIKEAELRELEIRINEMKLLQKEYSDRRNVQLKLPHSPIYPRDQETNELHKEYLMGEKFDLLEDLFDFSRCSISSLFRVFLYTLPNDPAVLSQNYYDEFVSHNHYITTNPTEACIYVAIMDSNLSLENLSYFGSNGKNHLLIDVYGKYEPKMVDGAMLVSNRLSSKNYRKTMDIAVDLSIPNSDRNRWRRLAQLFPIHRKYFLTFIANPKDLNEQQLNDLPALKKSMESAQDIYYIDFDCSLSNESICYGRDERLSIGNQSIFTLIFPDLPSFQQRFYESLETGSVPVICSLHAPLPFEDLVDWRLAVIRIPLSRFPELHFILRSISATDLIELKRKGRYFFENYLADIKVLTRSILSSIRFRLQMPGIQQPETKAIPLYNKSDWQYPSFISTATKPPYDDEYLGPNEMPTASQGYMHNFTSFTIYSYSFWNNFPFAIEYTQRFFPNDYPLPSNGEFNEDTSFGMRPILPGSGMEFSKGIGGNRPREQFTIVIVSFNREQVLANTLERLNGLPYLNRIIIIWNDMVNSPTLSAWPHLHVPLLFVNGTRNSLNNRFIPYEEIETEAILSMDDDIDLKQYEIIFAFRVWREQRDRIVGFPARYHAYYGNENFYNSNHTCQYSMILTGAAFLHKFYLHAYTYFMPSIIRQKIDEWMNCEDLAMNFLVSHLTRKPPIKTTSKWTLRCPTCTETLSNDMEHFNERHECIRFFTHVYGYNPLLFTQFRVDSVLFKTRVPTNHQKCFRYV